MRMPEGIRRDQDNLLMNLVVKHLLGVVVKGSVSDVQMLEGIRRDQDKPTHEPCCKTSRRGGEGERV